MAALPGRHADRRPTSTRSCPTGRSSSPTATTTARGSTRRALELAGIDRDTPDPAGRPHRARRRRRTRPARSTRARCPWSRGCVPPTTEERVLRRAAGRAGLPALAGRHRLAGRDRRRLRRAWTTRRPTYRRRGRRGDLTGSHVVGALWWERERGLEQVADLVGAAGGAHRRPVPGDEREDHAGRRRRELHGGDDRRPTSTGAATRPTTPGTPSSTPPRCARRCAALDAAGFQVHVHAIGDRGVREALDAFARRTEPRPRCATTSPTCSWSTPTTSPRFAALGVAANMQALWACHDDQMVELTLPFLGEERARWQYPFGALHRAGARLVMGSDWPVSTPRPAGGHPHGRHPDGVRRARAVRARSRSCPEQAMDLTTAFAAYTSGSAWVNHRDDAGVLAAGSRRRPGGARPGPVRRPGRGDRRRPGAGRPGSTGRPVHEAR